MHMSQVYSSLTIRATDIYPKQIESTVNNFQISHLRNILGIHWTKIVWSEPSVRRISTSVSVGVGMCSVVAMQADPRCAESATDTT